jgi:hypothetical protein
MVEETRRGWRELCLAVTNETDSEKLDSLVQDLITALDEGEREWRFAAYSSGAAQPNHQDVDDVVYGEDFTVINVCNPQPWAEIER